VLIPIGWAYSWGAGVSENPDARGALLALAHIQITGARGGSHRVHLLVSMLSEVVAGDIDIGIF
jgi:hypothetical protein